MFCSLGLGQPSPRTQLLFCSELAGLRVFRSKLGKPWCWGLFLYSRRSMSRIVWFLGLLVGCELPNLYVLCFGYQGSFVFMYSSVGFRCFVWYPLIKRDEEEESVYCFFLRLTRTTVTSAAIEVAKANLIYGANNSSLFGVIQMPPTGREPVIVTVPSLAV